MWGYADARVKMRGNRTVDVLREANARSREIANAIQLRDAGFINQEEAAKTLGIG